MPIHSASVFANENASVPDLFSRAFLRHIAAFPTPGFGERKRKMDVGQFFPISNIFLALAVRPTAQRHKLVEWRTVSAVSDLQQESPVTLRECYAVFVFKGEDFSLGKRRIEFFSSRRDLSFDPQQTIFHTASRVECQVPLPAND